MSDHSSAHSGDAHVLIPDHRRPMAKAQIRKADQPEMRQKIGRAIGNVAGGLGWNLDELAEAVKRDPRTVSRWLDGSERPQFDLLLAVPALGPPLVIALALLIQCDVETTIRVRVA